MAAIGALAVRVSADTQQFNKEMRNTQGPADALKKRMQSITKVSDGMKAALAAVGAATAAALIYKGFEAVTAQNRLARSLGTTTERVGGLTSAFRTVGLESDDVSDALNTLADRAKDAIDGAQSMKDDFALVGVTIEDLKNKKPDELFDLFAKAVAGAEDPTKRAAAVVRTLGDDLGRKLMPLLMEGPDAIRKYQKEAEALGVALNAVDAESIERGNTAFKGLGEVIQGVANQLAAKFAPLVEVLSNKFRAVAVETKGFKGAVESSFGGAVSAVGFFGDMIKGLQVTFKGVELVVNAFGAAVVNVIEGVAEGIAITIDTISAGINSVIQGINKIPGVTDIPLLGSVKNFELFEGIRNFSEQSRIQVIALKNELHNLAMEELPSDQLDKFVEEVTAASKKISEETIKAREGMNAMGTPGGKTDADKDEKRKKMEEELELIRARLAGEEEEIALSYERQLEKLREFKENELLTKQEYSDLEKQVEAQKEADITALKKRESEARERLEERSRKIQVSAAQKAFGDIVSATDANSKKMFRIQKAAAISNAVVGGWEAAVSAWKAGMSVGGPWAPLVAAAYTAASLAKTGAQIASIKSQSFSSSGSQSGGGGGSAPTPTTAGAPAGAGGGGAGGESRIANITVRGNNFSGDQIAQVATELGNFLSDSNGRMGDSRVRIMREA